MAKQNNYWETRIQKIYDKRRKDLSVDDLYRGVYESLHNEIKDLYSALKERDLTRTELYKSARFLSFRKDLSRQLTDISGSLNDKLAKTLIKAYKDAGLAAKDNIGKKSIWTLQNRHMAEACVERSWAGDNFSGRIWKNRAQLAKQVEQGISGIVITGMGRNQLLKELNGLDYRERFHPPVGVSQDEAEQALEAYLQRGRRQADCLVRTELMHTLNTAQIETYRAEGVNYLEFECEPTACPDCLSISEKNPYPIDKIPCTIVHPNCRCTWLAVEDEDVETVRADYAKKREKAVDKSAESDIIKSKADTTPKNASECKTYDELTKHFGDTYNITFDDSVKALNFESVKSGLSGVETVISEYPDLGNLLTTVTTDNSGVMCCNADVISFNPKFFKDKQKLLETCEEMSRIGHWVPNSSPESLGVHEAGHGVEWVLIQANPNYDYDFQRIMAWNACDEAKKIVAQACKNIKKTPYGKGKRKNDLIGAISRYATKNDSETMAEAFADVYANRSSANPLSIEIKRLTLGQMNKYKR